MAGKRVLDADEDDAWRGSVLQQGMITFDTHLEGAKRCFLRVMAWHRPPSALDRVNILGGMAYYHLERKDWVKSITLCEEALILLPETRKIVPMRESEAQLLLMLADAAEGQGDMKRALEYDMKAVEANCEHNDGHYLGEFVTCSRREAIQQLSAGKPEEAIRYLSSVPQRYVGFLEYSGINLSHVHLLQPCMAALKVLAAAMIETGIIGNLIKAGQIYADVEETEAILAGYREGVLEETRRELGEQRRAAAGAPSGLDVEAASATKKSKAAKRKQQKRKAQQQKKAAEQVEAAAAAARGENDTQGQGEGGTKAQEAQAKERQEMNRDEEGNAEGSQQAMTAAAAAFSAMAVSGTEGLEEQEEDEEGEDECSVCLNVIDSNEDAANPAGPALLCGHRYHAFCLQFWVEKCTSKCIEPTCPYCRSPLQEVGSI